MQLSSRSELARTLGAVFFLFALSLAVSAAVMWNRHEYERALDRVILAVDGKEAQQAARAASVPVTEFLRRLRSAGATAVAVHEYTLQDALGDGRAFLVTQSGLKALLPAAAAPVALNEAPRAAAPAIESPAPDSSAAGAASQPGDDPADAPSPYLYGVDLSAADPWFAKALADRLPEDFLPVYRDGPIVIWQFPPTLSLANASLGFDPRDFEAAREAGLDIVPRLRPAEERSLAEIRETIGRLDGERVAAIVFWGDTVTGYPGALGEVAAWLAPHDAPVGLIEFAEQRGVKELARALDYRAVRVHSITAEEMQAGISQGVAVRRWERAVRERGVRLAYVRLYPGVPLEASEEYVSAVAARIKGAGFQLGRAVGQGGPPGRSPLWTLLIAAAASGAAGAWLLARAVRRFALLLVAAGLLAPCAAVLLLWLKGHTVLARQFLAGAAAVIYPSLAALVGLECARLAAQRTGERGKESRAFAGIAPALTGFAASVAVTLAGAMAVVVALDDVRFILKIEEFRGVKAAYLAPLALVAAAMALERARLAPKGRGGAGARRLVSWLTAPVKVWHVLLGAGILGAVSVYVLRSGNQGLPLFGVEAALRAFLEESFAARPRTKEFLVGHPAMIAGFALAASGKGRGGLFAAAAFPLVLLGTVGPVSVINTFAHAHSPLALSLIRTAYALLIGTPLGIGLAAALLWIAGRWAGAIGGRPRDRRSAPSSVATPGSGA